MKKMRVLNRLGVLSLWLLSVDTVVGQDGPPPLPEVGLYLNGFRFDDTNHWWSLRETAPLSATNVQAVPSWHTNAARLAGSGPSYLNYKVFETNGLRNLYPERGSIWMWIRPLWSTTNGGLGYSARLIEAGQFNSADGWWSLHIAPQGDRIIFAGESNGVGAVFLESPPVHFVSNKWAHLVLNYTATNSALYTNGVLATNGSGVTHWPSDSLLSNGFFIGSDRYGLNLAQADFEWLRLYDNPSANFYYSHFTNTLAKIEAWENGGGGEGLMSGGGSEPLLDGGSSGESFGSGLMLSDPAVGGGSFLTTITGGAVGVWYDFFRGSELSGNSPVNSEWTWLGRGQDGIRYTLPGLPQPNAFYLLGTPHDSDADGVPDAYENLVLKTQPHNTDTDGDGISDGLEDPDADGLSNIEEYRLWYNLADADSNDNGIRDGYEDADGDFLSNAVEAAFGTDSLLFDDLDSDTVADWRDDSDSDGLPDSYERASALNPTSAEAAPTLPALNKCPLTP